MPCKYGAESLTVFINGLDLEIVVQMFFQAFIIGIYGAGIGSVSMPFAGNASTVFPDGNFDGIGIRCFEYYLQFIAVSAVAGIF